MNKFTDLPLWCVYETSLPFWVIKAMRSQDQWPIVIAVKVLPKESIEFGEARIADRHTWQEKH